MMTLEDTAIVSISALTIELPKSSRKAHATRRDRGEIAGMATYYRRGGRTAYVLPTKIRQYPATPKPAPVR